MLRKLLLLSVFCLIGLSAKAQLEEVIHHTFNPEDIPEIHLNLIEEYELLPWAGNQILTETYIELYDASPEILKFLIEEKARYEIVSSIQEGFLLLSSTDQDRAPIQFRGNTCSEFVRTKIYIPDSYQDNGEGLLIRVD
ncbi:MAG: hypothetical protein GYB31_08805 [Bacteroidetes bacterium]|nr:hypothetical protein [Bacteroidota bacterium]